MSNIEKAPEIKPETTSEERTWAALAHISGILTLLVSLGTLGAGGILFVFVPFVIYLIYKDKSRYVANQAAQAFALQVVGTVGFLLAFLIWILVLIFFWLITAVLCVILIGIVLVPVGAVLSVVLPIAWAAIPFVLGAYAIAAAVQTANGNDYQYPYLGRYVTKWLEQHEAESAPAV
jgi:uncharacterized Tic20 family protein